MASFGTIGMRIVLAAIGLLSLTRHAHAQVAAVWQAGWIGASWSSERDGSEIDGSRPLPVFRRAFEVSGTVRRAELRIAGLGQWQAHLASQGRLQTVGGEGLHQAWTDYRKTIPYETIDVTSMLQPGPVVLSVMLGNGMYNVQKSTMPNGKARYTKFEGSFGMPKLTVELTILYADQHTETITSDASWKVARGPVVFDSTYGGEDFDSRAVARGWEQPGFNDAAWQTAITTSSPGGQMIPAIAPPVLEAATHRPVKTTTPAPGKTVYDLGVNFAGIPQIQVHGPAGAILRLTPGELLKPDGTVSQGSSGGPMWWSYTLNADPQQSWKPLFGYYGFRYLQAEWMPAAGAVTSTGTIDSIAGIELHTSSPSTGTFASSSDFLNSIHAMIVNAMHNNSVSLFTDCPHREKLGWLEETHLVAAGLMFNNDVAALYQASARNMMDAQTADGMIPTIAPQYTKFGPKYAIYDDSPEWGSAEILGAWSAFRFYGERAALAEAYPAMQRYIAYLQSRTTDGIVAYGLGDWYDIGPGGPGFEKNTSLGVTGTLMLYEDAVALSHVARLLRHDENAARYDALAHKTAAAFNRKFWKSDKGWYDTGSQTANAMPLALGIVPEEERARVLEHVIDDLHAHQDHVTTGEVGFPYLLRLLMDAGRNDVILAMMLRRDPPSYGSQLEAGATALTEAWDANPRSSQDHFMLGAAEEWFYRGLGGIDIDLSRAQADVRLTIAPKAVSGLDWVRCSYHSRLGQVESDWKHDGNTMIYTITVPVAATVKLPRGAVLINEKTSAANGAFHVQAGLHRFRATL